MCIAQQYQKEEDGEMKQSAKEKTALTHSMREKIVCDRMRNVRIEARKPCIHTNMESKSATDSSVDLVYFSGFFSRDDFKNSHRLILMRVCVRVLVWC